MISYVEFPSGECVRFYRTYPESIGSPAGQYFTQRCTERHRINADCLPYCCIRLVVFKTTSLCKYHIYTGLTRFYNTHTPPTPDKIFPQRPIRYYKIEVNSIDPNQHRYGRGNVPPTGARGAGVPRRNRRIQTCSFSVAAILVRRYQAAQHVRAASQTCRPDDLRNYSSPGDAWTDRLRPATCRTTRRVGRMAPQTELHILRGQRQTKHRIPSMYVKPLGVRNFSMSVACRTTYLNG